MAGIYLHIPFCRHRCVYCDFFSSTDQTLRADYVGALCRELELRRPYLGNAEVDTVYIGGGTPSQLSVEELEQIFSYIYKVYKFAKKYIAFLQKACKGTTIFGNMQIFLCMSIFFRTFAATFMVYN